MKPQERTSFRELNKSPLIKFPIKESISTYAHKVSLTIQVQLGGIELPLDKNFNRRQYMAEHFAIFDRVQRLIRCIVECKTHDGDAVSTNNALEFARGISAGYWENMHLQLRQLPTIGPAANRRLVQADVKTIRQLANMATSDIERILSRNPPLGKKILDYAKAFPTLSIKAEIVEKVIKVGRPVKVKIKARLGCTHVKVSSWKNQTSPLTFLATVSNGYLAHLERGSMKRLETGFDVTFMAELTGPDDIITCQIACDEVVGTVKTIDLKPDFPLSAFSMPQAHPETISTGTKIIAKSTGDNTEFELGDLDESDLLAAIDDADATCMTQAQGSGNDRFLDIDALDVSERDERRKEQDEVFIDQADENDNAGEPTQMANGKWECNHICANGGLTRAGKLCSHKCCREGLNKPRPRSKIKVGEIHNSMFSEV